MDSLLIITRKVERVSQVVKSWVMHRVQGNRFSIVSNGFLQLAVVAIRITKIVVALNLLGIDL